MNGSGGNERFEVTPMGGRTWVTRDLDAIRMDLDGVERLDILPGLGGDIVRVADVSGTDTDNVFVNLALARSSTATDQTIDRVFVDGTNGTDAIDVDAFGPQVRVKGAAAIVTTSYLRSGARPAARRHQAGQRLDQRRAGRVRADRIHVVAVIRGVR